MTKIKTDDQSFSLYLNNLSHNDLLVHACTHITAKSIHNFIMKKENIQIEIIKMMYKNDVEFPEFIREIILKGELEDSDDDATRKYMTLLFSKKDIINMLIEYSDTDNRLNIINNQNEWNKPINRSIIFN